MTDSLQRALLDQLRAAMDEYDAAIDDVLRLAADRGQSDDAFPLVVVASDVELAAAVNREIAAGAEVQQLMRKLIASER